MKLWQYLLAAAAAAFALVAVYYLTGENLLYNLMVIILVAAATIAVFAGIVAGIAIVSRAPTGRGTGGRGAYFAGWRARIPGIPGVESDFFPNFGKMFAGVVILLWAVYMTGLFPDKMFSFWGTFGQMAFYSLVVAVIAMTKPVAYADKVAFRLVIIAAAALGTGETIHMVFGCDEACKITKQEVAQAEARKAAAKEVRDEQYRAAIQAEQVEALKPASSAECPGIVPTAPMPLDTVWHVFTRKCDMVWAVVDRTGKKLPDEAVEFDPPYGIPNRVRMKTSAGGLYIMDCPPGSGPADKVWRCKPRGVPAIIRQAGIQLGVGVYYK